MRLSKLIAERGVASRREAEQLVRDGVVTVNGQRPEHPGVEVDADRDHVKVHGKRLPPPVPKVVLALNKPAGCVTTSDDPQERKTVVELLAGTRYHNRVQPVGRLDYGSEGLLLLTNDGELAQQLTHPRHHVSKTYFVKITGTLDERKLALLRRGVPLKDGRTKPALVRVTEARERNSWLRVQIQEGRNRQVRRMIEFVGHRVLRLRRTAIGELRIGDLPRGGFRVLSGAEVQSLRDEAAGAGEERFARALERQQRAPHGPPPRGKGKRGPRGTGARKGHGRGGPPRGKRRGR